MQVKQGAKLIAVSLKKKYFFLRIAAYNTNLVFGRLT